jgi:hypothetical protein
METDGSEEIAFVEAVSEETAAVIDGDVVGEVDGLIWEDASGVDIVCITIGTSQVAAPVNHGEWRTGGWVVLGFDAETLEEAPQLTRLIASGGANAVEEVATHFSLGLTGPPPGPDPQPLPPWWD